jgi:alkylhydroperoxidase/carboxymuconolactone decarboxylase family protein YurZ
MYCLCAVLGRIGSAYADCLHSACTLLALCLRGASFSETSAKFLPNSCYTPAKLSLHFCWHSVDLCPHTALRLTLKHTSVIVQSMHTPLPTAPNAASAIEHLCRVVVCAAFNQPDLFSPPPTPTRTPLHATLRQALQAGVAHKALYEALLQVYLHAGFPATLEALSALASVANEDVANTDVANANAQDSDADAHITQAADYDVALFRTRGAALFERIYTSAAQPMLTRLGGVSADIREWMIVEGYGKTLGRDGLTVLERELLSVAVLAALGWQTQLYSHLRGALNVGASENNCLVALDSLLALATLNETADNTSAASAGTFAPPSLLSSLLRSRHSAACTMLAALVAKRKSG